MAGFKIFIDGGAGTTGLRIRQRLQNAPGIELISLPEAQRKDLPARLAAMEQADITILCLPDDAAKQVAQAAPPTCRIIDTSTAHRTNPQWVYGFAELHGNTQKIQNAQRVTVPGCHATGFIALAAPLVQAGALSKTASLCCHSTTGYSGGGKQMIAAYESPTRPAEYKSPRLYALAMQHKHLPEMAAVSGLATPPLFTPTVADFYSGMLVTLPLQAGMLAAPYQNPEALAALFIQYYAGCPLVTVHPAGSAPSDGFIAANGMAGRDSLEIFVLGNQNTPLLAARFDNLGKGASGAAIQCMNLMLGREATQNLVH